MNYSKFKVNDFFKNLLSKDNIFKTVLFLISLISVLVSQKNRRFWDKPDRLIGSSFTQLYKILLSIGD